MIYLYPATTTFLDSERGAGSPEDFFFLNFDEGVFFWGGGLVFVYIQGACEIANFLPMLRLMVQKSGLTSWEKGSLSHLSFIPQNNRFYTSQVVGLGNSEPSTVFFFCVVFSQPLYKQTKAGMSPSFQSHLPRRSQPSTSTQLPEQWLSCLSTAIMIQSKNPSLDLNLGGGFQYFLFSPRKLGKMNPVWRAYFSKGLVQPPTKLIFFSFHPSASLSLFWGKIFREVPS